MSDPITQVLQEYNSHLRSGGEPADLSRFPNPPHASEKKLSASSLAMCDRKAAYSIMEDLGEIEADVPFSQELLLDFRIGNHMEEFVAQAMEWKGVLVGYQTRLTNGHRKGRLDLEIDPKSLLGSNKNAPNWIVEIKFTKNAKPENLHKYYPKANYIAQAQFYSDHSENRTVPVLYIAMRTTFEAVLYTWLWEDGDANVLVWDDEFGWTFHRTMPDLKAEIAESDAAQVGWMETGELPPRVAQTIVKHPFLCTRYNRSTKRREASCQYLGRCWGEHAAPYMED